MNEETRDFLPGIQQLKSENGKPTFLVEYKTALTTSSGFEEKLLSDGMVFNAGSACGLTCAYCSVKTTMRMDPQIRAILEKTGLDFHAIKIRRKDAVGLIRNYLAPNGIRRFEDPNDNRIIEGSSLVDVAAHMNDVRQTLEICAAILELTPWRIRLLSKSTLLLKIAKGISEIHKSRVLFGFSCGILNPSLSRAIEVGASPIERRIEALRWLQRNKYVTFGMLCPVLPMRDYSAFAEEALGSIDERACHEIFVEPLNARGDSIVKTAAAARAAGFEREAEALERIRNKAEHEEYAKALFGAFWPRVSPGKLRFLHNTTLVTHDWWNEVRHRGAIALPSPAVIRSKPSSIIEKDPSPNAELTAGERTELSRLESVVRSADMADLEAGKALAQIADRKLYRATHKTFAKYVRDRLDMGPAHAYRLINYSRVVADLSPNGDNWVPSNESQARLLFPLNNHQRAEVMNAARERAAGASITTALLRATIAETIPSPQPRVAEPPGSISRRWIPQIHRMAQQANKLDLPSPIRMALHELERLLRCEEGNSTETLKGIVKQAQRGHVQNFQDALM